MTEETRKLWARILRAVAMELDPPVTARRMPMPDQPPPNPPPPPPPPG